jgi:hypothetical protein
MADRKAQLAITADASGVEAGVGKAKRSISSLGQAAKTAGQEASKGLGGIGEGAAPATAKVDAATKSMIRSIERVTFATEAGGRTSARYFQLLAEQRGVNPEALRPYLEQLDLVASRQRAVSTGVNIDVTGIARAAAAQAEYRQAVEAGIVSDLSAAKAKQQAAAAARDRLESAVRSAAAEADYQRAVQSGAAVDLQAARAQQATAAAAREKVAALVRSASAEAEYQRLVKEGLVVDLAAARASQRTAAALGNTAQSARATAAALRQVPAQLTDIVVSLQAGQAPLTVLLQQGGQLRDVFGGIAPAARALGSAVVRLINPFTLLGGAAVALGVAYNQGSKEADAYNRALILTGNSAGTTAGQLQSMAESIDGIVGTQSEAAAALAQFAATGAVAASNLEKLTIVAIRLDSLGGKAIAETVKEFAALGKDPVDASAKLNEQYNYLTLSVYEQIKALQEQGRVTEAAALAQAAFADALNTRADRLSQNLGYIERAWRGVTGAAKEAWDAMLNVGRASTPQTELAGLRRQLEALDQGANLGPEFGGTQGSPAAARARQQLLDQIAALEDINQVRDGAGRGNRGHAPGHRGRAGDLSHPGGVAVEHREAQRRAEEVPRQPRRGAPRQPAEPTA